LKKWNKCNSPTNSQKLIASGFGLSPRSKVFRHRPEVATLQP